MINIAVMGYGTVGAGVVEVIQHNQKEVSTKAGDAINVKYILDIRKFPGDPNESLITDDYEKIINDPEIKIICETMGGLKPAYDFTKRALEKGISVCTSNKEMVAAYGAELIAIAKNNNCNYLFEASVGGGIPIIRALNSSLTPERIHGIAGILNGTTNYMLTKMDEEGESYDDVLATAQKLGYAERNPEADVEGYDACRKIAILSSLVYGKTVKFDEIHTEGITKISTADFAYAKEMGRSIKLLGVSMDIEGKCFAMVAPFLVDKEDPLYCVRDVFNAVCVDGNMLGKTMYYGKGAGRKPTASAVVSDVIDAAKHLGKFIFCFWEDEKVELVPKDNISWKYFIRVKGVDKETEIKRMFENSSVVTTTKCPDEFGLITDRMKERDFLMKIKDIPEVISYIRIYE